MIKFNKEGIELIRSEIESKDEYINLEYTKL